MCGYPDLAYTPRTKNIRRDTMIKEKIDEKLFDDAIQLASLWLTNSKAVDTKDYRHEVEGCVQGVYRGLIALRGRLLDDER
jgi:hypothetical protein